VSILDEKNLILLGFFEQCQKLRQIIEDFFINKMAKSIQFRHFIYHYIIHPC